MGVSKQSIRQHQLERLEQKIAGRKAVLAQRGMDEQAQEKDVLLQHLIAEARRTRKALEAIKKQAALMQAARQKKLESAARSAAAKKHHKKKAAEAAAPPSGDKKEKKAKKAADKKEQAASA
ncbi:MAG: hypothetical protein N3B18_05415 [Desulfobacterota bacterium]|nr:hypothetical protein [Thermodesulfobacteriota bacterium]